MILSATSTINNLSLEKKGKKKSGDNYFDAVAILTMI
jgi:hypothetical protein